MRTIFCALTALTLTAAAARGDDIKQPYDISVMKNAMALGLGTILSTYPGATQKSSSELWNINSKVFTYAYEWNGSPAICVLAPMKLLDPASPTPTKMEVLCGNISFERVGIPSP
jgi:hypothetical protein